MPDLAAQGKAMLFGVKVLVIIVHRELLFDSRPGQCSEPLHLLFLVHISSRGGGTWIPYIGLGGLLEA